MAPFKLSQISDDDVSDASSLPTQSQLDAQADGISRDTAIGPQAGPPMTEEDKILAQVQAEPSHEDAVAQMAPGPLGAGTGDVTSPSLMAQGLAALNQGANPVNPATLSPGIPEPQRYSMLDPGSKAAGDDTIDLNDPKNDALLAASADQLASRGGGAGLGRHVAAGSADASADASAPSLPIKAGDSGMNPILQQYLQDRGLMQQAQGAANSNQLLAGLAQAGATVGHALSRSQTPMDQSGFKALQANAGTPVTEMQQMQKAGMDSLQTQSALQTLMKTQAAQDPNSPLSKNIIGMYQSQLKQFGANPELISAISNMSAADADKYAKTALEHTVQWQNMRDMKEMQLAQMRAMKELAQGNRTGALQDRDYTATLNSLIAARGQKATQQAESDLYAANKVNSITRMFNNDTNAVGPVLKELLTEEVAKMAQGGVPNEGTVDKLNQKAWPERVARAWQAVGNAPTRAEAGAFVDQLVQYSNEIKKDAQSHIQENYGRIIRSNAPRIGKDNTQLLVDNYLRRFDPTMELNPTEKGPGASATQGIASVDPAIQSFAKDNGISVQRAAAILSARKQNGQGYVSQ